MTRRIVFLFMLNAVIFLLIPTAITAAEPFYQGKTLRVVVASAAGGGSDIVARLIMGHLSRHVPGNPTIIIENMPGAGEVIGVNYVHNKAKPDGLTALFATGTPITQRKCIARFTAKIRQGPLGKRRKRWSAATR